MGTIYGYCRISTKKQNIERQERNIKASYPDAHIIKEVYTGTTTDRPEWNKLLHVLKTGDTVVFDSVSRMSRDAAEGFNIYKQLYYIGVSLIFLKELHINTESYTTAKDKITLPKVQSGDATTDKLINTIMAALNEFMMSKIEDDIVKAFKQAEKEVKDLQQRTKEGIKTARLNGKQIGQKKGVTFNLKAKEPRKNEILRLSKDFNGVLTDIEVMKIIGISRNTYYKYKQELKNKYNF